MKLTIRRIVKEDIELIAKYENEYFHNFMTKEKLMQDLSNPLLKYYVLVETEICGYVGLWIDEDKAQINTLVIVKEYREKGYGKYLLEFVMKKLEEESIKEVTLEVRPSNQAALKLYQNQGFKQIAVRKNYYNNGEDAFLMYKRLGSG